MSGSPLHIHFDCPAGASGDMIVSSLLDLGVDEDELRAALASLPLGEYEIHLRSEKRMYLRGLRFSVSTTSPQPHRRYPDVIRMLEESGLPPRVRNRAVEAFGRLAQAEARVHGTPVEAVHFHEVGAVDSIIDVVGAMWALHRLGVESCTCSALPMGEGLTGSEHGSLPLPAPATLELLNGVPVYGAGLQGETVTPTGAAVLTTVCSAFGPMPAFRLRRIGYGLGSRQWPDRPNALRAILGTRDPASRHIIVLETNVDDSSPELAGYLMDRLFEEGALDVAFLPAHMKKNRPGYLIQVLCPVEKRDRIAELVLSESSTIGVRWYAAERIALPRRNETIDTAFGTVEVKVVDLPDGSRRYHPEYASCAEIARRLNLPVQEIYAEVTAACRRHPSRPEPLPAKRPAEGEEA